MRRVLFWQAWPWGILFPFSGVRVSRDAFWNRGFGNPLLGGCHCPRRASGTVSGRATVPGIDRADLRTSLRFLPQRRRAKRGPVPRSGQALLKGGESGPAILTGKPDESLIVSYISGDEPEMPKGQPRLSTSDVVAIRQWVEAGAPWPAEITLEDRSKSGPWWSLAPLVRPAVPEVSGDCVRTPIDAFILAKQNELGLRHAAEADRRMLIRRLSFDLHGLPPTPEEVDAFLADVRPDAYEQLVDRLLASPRYGERWGRYWLDVVHYGESHGYDKDKPRPNAWPYRDYVIDSLNADKPYSRFVLEQLAGDVCSPTTRRRKSPPASWRRALGILSAIWSCAREQPTRRSPARTIATTW